MNALQKLDSKLDALREYNIPPRSSELFGPSLAQKVSQANILSQRMGYEDKKNVLTTIERRIILYLFSMVGSMDCEFYPQEIKMLDLARHVKVKNLHGGNYRKQFSKLLKNLASKQFLLRISPDRCVRVNWIEEPVFESNQGRGYVTLKLHDDLLPYLTNLKQIGKTIFYYGYSLRMEHRHSIDLYLLFKSAQKLGKWVAQIHDFKLLVGNAYEQFCDIERYILLPSLDEINTITDLRVEYHVKRKNRKVQQIIFTIDSIWR